MLLRIGFIVALLTNSLYADQMRRLFDAIKQQETGSRTSNFPRGDNGKARGPYQIWYSYWLDSKTPGSYSQVDDKAYAERVMRNYWRRYCPNALRTYDFEVLARVHNGGPAGARRSATLPYWRSVKKFIKKP